jgi:hypothetical protein
MTYRVIDHIHGFKKQKFDTSVEATEIAFKLAKLQTIFNDRRIHISVMAGRKQITEINIRQEEGNAK